MKLRQYALFALFVLAATHTLPGVRADENISGLVDNLSSRKFAVRQQAMADLIQLGSVVIPELEQAMANGNRELQFRAQRVLDAVEQNAYQLKLEAFMQSGEQSVKLPGWTKFREAHGDSSTARRLFVLMCRAEPDLMRNLDRSVGVVSNLINVRCRELYQVFRTQRNDGIQLGTIAALLFVGGVEGVRVDDLGVKTIYASCNFEAFRNEMFTRRSNGTASYRRTLRSEMLRDMFAESMQRGQSWDLQMAFNMAMQYDIRQCLPQAIELVRSKNTPCHVAQTALVAVIRFGEKANIPDLETRIDDKSFCGVARRIGKKLYQTQLRDIALAGALTLADQNPREYGFDRIEYTFQRHLNYSTVGFAEDAARDAARKKYDEFRATLKIPKSLPEDNNQ